VARVGRLGSDTSTTQDTATCRRHSAKRDVNFHSINEPSCGFQRYFPRISHLRWRAIRGNLPHMNIGHSNRQKTAKRSHEVRQVARDHASGLSDRVLSERMQASSVAGAVDVALCEKPYELLSPTIWSAENSVNCRLLSNFKSGLTVKNRKQHDEKVFTVRFTVKTIRLGAIDVDRRRKVIFEISVSYAREPIEGDRSRKAKLTPTQ
jgi:hypothetical protein